MSGEVVADRQVLHAALAPERYRALLPAETDLEVFVPVVLVQHVQQGFTLQTVQATMIVCIDRFGLFAVLAPLPILLVRPVSASELSDLSQHCRLAS